MVLYQCPRCHYETERKCNIKTHYRRKKVCNPLYSDIETKKLEIKSLSKTEVKKESSESELERLRKQLEEKDKQIHELIGKVGNNNNNTINIHIHDFNKTNYGVALQDIKEHIKNVTKGVCDNIQIGEILKLVHCNEKYPENYNMLITDKTRDEIKLKEGDEFKIYPKNDTMEEIMNKIINILEENKICPKDIEKYMKTIHNNDTETKSKEKKEFERALYNNRHKVIEFNKENGIKIN